MFYNLRKKLGYWRFHQTTKGIFDTAPVDVSDGDTLMLSMACHRDVQMYLLALKSFLRHFGKARVEIVDDGSLTEADKFILSSHLEGLKITHISSVDLRGCQAGGTWERLISIIERSAEQYVIQLDADTLTCGDISEVVDCAANNRAFVLGEDSSVFVDLVETAKRADQHDMHICDTAERAFARYPDAVNYKYVRGSSGFSGFGKGLFSIDQLVDFHHKMMGLLGDRWLEWSSEQISSNFAIANSPGAMALPFPKYLNFQASLIEQPAHFIHFIGSHRFYKQHFAKLGRKQIQQMHTGK